jgi:putative ABC transport system permease protein
MSLILGGAILASIGGAHGRLLSLPLPGYSTGTLSFSTFSEVVFQFRITPALAVKGMTFALLAGIVGSLLPALRASRLPVIAALKAV